MSLYKGNNLISGAMPNSANQSLSNLNSAGQDIIDNKANVDLANVTNTGKILMSSMSMPSSTYINLATPVNNSQYVAPADGYFTLRVNQLIGTVGMIRLTSSNNILSYCTSTGAERSTTAGVTIPVRKGVTVTVGLFGTNSGIDMFRFYYAVGSESEVS